MNMKAARPRPRQRGRAGQRHRFIIVHMTAARKSSLSPIELILLPGSDGGGETLRQLLSESASAHWAPLLSPPYRVHRFMHLKIKSWTFFPLKQKSDSLRLSAKSVFPRSIQAIIQRLPLSPYAIFAPFSSYNRPGEEREGK